MEKKSRARNLPNSNASAFTLVEVMVTLTILGIVVLVTFGVFRMGLSAWEKGESTREGYQTMRIASHRISQQMKSLMPYRVKTEKAEGNFLAFEGRPRSLKFISTLSLRTGKPSGFVYVVYEFQEGGTSGGRLLQYEGRVVNKNFMDEEPSSDGKVSLFEDLADVQFEYYRASNPDKNQEEAWVSEWIAKEEKEFPKAMRMTIQFRNKEGGAEEPVILLASIPSNEYEEVWTSPLMRRGGRLRR